MNTLCLVLSHNYVITINQYLNQCLHLVLVACILSDEKARKTFYKKVAMCSDGGEWRDNFHFSSNTRNYFTKSNLSVTVSQRHQHLSEEIFYDSLGIGIQICGGAKSALRCPRIWLPTFDVIILEAIAYKVNGGIQIRGGSKSAGDPNPRGIQIRGGSKSALRVSKSASVFGLGIQIHGDPNPRLHMHCPRTCSYAGNTGSNYMPVLPVCSLPLGSGPGTVNHTCSPSKHTPSKHTITYTSSVYHQHTHSHILSIYFEVFIIVVEPNSLRLG